eukprot:scaffold38287_cov214-Amphora_coffeaeformis.AAC.1
MKSNERLQCWYTFFHAAQGALGKATIVDALSSHLVEDCRHFERITGPQEHADIAGRAHTKLSRHHYYNSSADVRNSQSLSYGTVGKKALIKLIAEKITKDNLGEERSALVVESIM